MKVDLSKYFDEGESFFEIEGNLEVGDLDIENENFQITDPVEYQVQVYTLSDNTREATLTIKYRYTEPCSRCLEPSIGSIETTLSGKLIEGNEDEFVEDSDEEDEIEHFIFYENNQLDILEYVRIQIYLSKPMQILCKPECKGLCSKCGINLNEKECNCDHEDIDPRLAGLKDFFSDD